MSTVRATIEPATELPTFNSVTGIARYKWAIIFHTSQGREEFDRYPTKSAARADARHYDIRLEN